MKKKITYAISEYIRKHFRDDFLLEVKDVTQTKNGTYYFIEVTKDDRIYKLKFDDDGKLLSSEYEETFPVDPHDGPGFSGIPE